MAAEREKVEAAKLRQPGPEASKHHFLCILLVTATHRQPRFLGREIDNYLLIEGVSCVYMEEGINGWLSLEAIPHIL